MSYFVGFTNFKRGGKLKPDRYQFAGHHQPNKGALNGLGAIRSRLFL
jgi:hypothetical protein